MSLQVQQEQIVKILLLNIEQGIVTACFLQKALKNGTINTPD